MQMILASRCRHQQNSGPCLDIVLLQGGSHCNVCESMHKLSKVCCCLICTSLVQHNCCRVPAWVEHCLLQVLPELMQKPVSYAADKSGASAAPQSHGAEATHASGVQSALCLQPVAGVTHWPHCLAASVDILPH